MLKSIEAAAAAVIAGSSHGPFGEVERAAGRWLPHLRLTTAVTLTAAAVGARFIGATGGVLPAARWPCSGTCPVSWASAC